MLENQITFQEAKNHAEEIREEETWMKNLIRGSIEEESWRNLRSIWQAFGSILEESGKHLGALDGLGAF